MKYLGKYWNSNDLDVYKINEKNIVLNKWNGEIFYDCFELDEKLIEVIRDEIAVRPVNNEISEDNFEIVDFEIL